jgi:hypothetical protein
MKTAVLLVACGLMLSACTTAHHFLVGAPGPPYAGPVAIHLQGTEPEGEFEEVAVVQASLEWGLFTDADIEHVLPMLQKRAAELGCDTVLHVRIDNGRRSITATGMAARSSPLLHP